MRHISSFTDEFVLAMVRQQCHASINPDELRGIMKVVEQSTAVSRLCREKAIALLNEATDKLEGRAAA